MLGSRSRPGSQHFCEKPGFRKPKPRPKPASCPTLVISGGHQKSPDSSSFLGLTPKMRLGNIQRSRSTRPSACALLKTNDVRDGEVSLKGNCITMCIFINECCFDILLQTYCYIIYMVFSLIWVLRSYIDNLWNE